MDATVCCVKRRLGAKLMLFPTLHSFPGPQAAHRGLVAAAASRVAGRRRVNLERRRAARLEPKLERARAVKRPQAGGVAAAAMEVEAAAGRQRRACRGAPRRRALCD